MTHLRVVWMVFDCYPGLGKIKNGGFKQGKKKQEKQYHSGFEQTNIKFLGPEKCCQSKVFISRQLYKEFVWQSVVVSLSTAISNYKQNRVYIYIYVCMYVCMYVCVCVCVCIFICICICTCIYCLSVASLAELWAPNQHHTSNGHDGSLIGPDLGAEWFTIQFSYRQVIIKHGNW